MLRNDKSPKKSKCMRESARGQHGRNVVRCAERGGSAMMLWQHEFYYVLEIEETGGRNKAPPKPYLYQALQFSVGRDLPDDEKKECRERSLAKCMCKELRMLLHGISGYTVSEIKGTCFMQTVMTQMLEQVYFGDVPRL